MRIEDVVSVLKELAITIFTTPKSFFRALPVGNVGNYGLNSRLAIEGEGHSSHFNVDDAPVERYELLFAGE